MAPHIPPTCLSLNSVPHSRPRAVNSRADGIRDSTTASGTAGVTWPQGPGDGVETQAGRAPITQMSACVASHTISRLCTEQQKDVLVTVYNKKGEKVLSIPLIDYALLVKGSYAKMDDQEYLDRQDKYDLVFFLDEGDRWMSAYIYINSWKLVLQNTDL